MIESHTEYIELTVRQGCKNLLHAVLGELNLQLLIYNYIHAKVW
jgi:hypothetical protein